MLQRLQKKALENLEEKSNKVVICNEYEYTHALLMTIQR